MALTPPISKDGLIYHLVGPKLFIQNRGIRFISGNFYTNFPFTIEMLFTMGMLLKGPILAKLIHCSFGLLTLGIIFQWTAQKASPSTGLFAAAIFYTLPLVAKLSTWAYIDLGLAFFITTMIIALLDWAESHHKGFLLLSGLFAGLAMGTKYTGIVMVLIIMLGAILFLRRQNKAEDLGISVFRVFFVGAVVALPWYLKNWILTGNPVYPFLYSLFGGREWSEEMARLYALFLSFIGSGPGILDYLKIPWDICFLGGEGRPDFDGYIGPIFLLVPLLSMVARPKGVAIRIMLFFSLVYFVLWGIVIQQLRFLVPIFPVLAMVLALLIHKNAKAWIGARLCILFFCVFTFAMNAYFYVDHFRRMAPHHYIAGLQSADQFLSSHLPSYQAITYINHHLTDRDKVLFVFLRNGLYYCNRPYVYDPVFEANTFMDMIKASASARAALALFRQNGITHILINENYVGPIASLLGDREGARLFDLMALLPLEGRFQNYWLYRLHDHSQH